MVMAATSPSLLMRWRKYRLRPPGYSAEYGNTGGGVERYVLKSGTNQWRGSVYEYLRNEAFDAAGFFDTVVPVHREHEWGGTFGGPLARNKAFFFFSFNRYTFKDAETTSILSMPTAGVPERRLLGMAAADLRPADHAAESGQPGPVHTRSVSRQHHSGEPHRSDGEEDPRVPPAAEHAGKLFKFHRQVPSENQRADDVRGQGRSPVQPTSPDEPEPRRDRRPGLYAKWIAASGRRPADQGLRLLVPARHPRLGDAAPTS